MDKNMKLLVVFLFCSLAAWGQESNDIELATSGQEAKTVQYGRGIAVSRQESTAASAMVTADDLSHKTSISPSNGLFGMLPGLQVLQNAGNAWNDDASMYVRGLGTTNGKKPLILVDGFERSISGLTTQEIESVTVLKDAASLALYGGRGANGVVYVKTKRGVNMAPVIDFTYQFNMGVPKNIPDFVDGYTYAQALNEALRNDGLAPRYDNRELEAFKNQTYPDFYPNVDWMKEALRDRSYGDNVNFSIRGGGNVAKYYAQINFLDDRGILKPVANNDGYSTQFKYSKLNIRTNLDVQLGKTTQLELSLLGNFSEHNRPGRAIQDIFTALYKVPSGAFPLKTSRGIWGGTSVYSNNPIAYISDTGYARSQSRSLYADMVLKQDLSSILAGLSGTVKIGLDNYAAYWDSNTKKFEYESAVKNWDGGDDTYKKLGESSELSFSNDLGAVERHINLSAQLDYTSSWKQHKLDAVLLYAMDKESNKGQNKTFSFIDMVAQAHYAYKGRYLLDVAMSASASSILEPGNRWGFFPAVSAGWLLSKENFLKADWLDLLKLRASYGIAGRADYAVNLYKATYGAGGKYFFKDTPSALNGMKEAQLPVSGLTYEKSHKWNVGVDFMAFGKLSMSVDAFYDHRTDILMATNAVTSAVLGITPPKSNSGVVDNYGMELALRWSDRIGHLNYNIGGQFTFTRNEIKEMNEIFRPHDYLKRTGRPLGQLFGYEVEGIYRDQAEIDSRPVKQLLSDVRPGDLKYKDQNNDNIIDEYDMVALGYNNTCPEIYYAFDLGAEYKGFGLTALFQGASRYSQVLNAPSVFRPLINDNTISKHYYANRWSEATPDAKYPRLTSTGSPNNYANNSLWIADASFLKLRTLELYYQLPEKWLSGTKCIKQMKVFARAHDLFSLDNMKVFDPESVEAAHPLMTQYVFGINLRF